MTDTPNNPRKPGWPGEDQMASYLLDELAPAQRERFERAMRADDDLRREIEYWCAALEAAKDWTAAEPPGAERAEQVAIPAVAASGPVAPESATPEPERAEAGPKTETIAAAGDLVAEPELEPTLILEPVGGPGTTAGHERRLHPALIRTLQVLSYAAVFVLGGLILDGRPDTSTEPEGAEPTAPPARVTDAGPELPPALPAAEPAATPTQPETEPAAPQIAADTKPEPTTEPAIESPPNPRPRAATRARARARSWSRPPWPKAAAKRSGSSTANSAGPRGPTPTQ